MDCTEMFKNAIGDYLSKMAESDTQFAVKLGNKNKTIEGCVNYIITQVKKSGRCGFTDDEVYGMAVHYYDEENVGDIDDLAGKCQIAGPWDLTEQEKEEARQRAISEYQHSLVQHIAKPKKPAQKQTENSSVDQLTLFDL